MLHFQAQPVLPTPEKRWYDRVVDSILGEDPCGFKILYSGVALSIRVELTR